MFNKNDFINWAQTAQKDNMTMTDFRNSHFNPMSQVAQVYMHKNENNTTQKQELNEFELSEFASVLKAVSKPTIKAAIKTGAKETAKQVGTQAAYELGSAGVRSGTQAVVNKVKKKEPIQSEGTKGEVAGAVAGTGVGMAIGTAVAPGPGTLIGGLIGGEVGGLVGNKLGGKAKSKKPIPVNASYETRKRAGMSSLSKLDMPEGWKTDIVTGAKRPLDPGIEGRAAASGQAYGHSTARPFGFGDKTKAIAKKAKEARATQAKEKMRFKPLHP